MATKKVTVTIPEDLLDEIRAEAAERGLSAYVAEALRFKRDRDRLLELVDWLQEEHGPVTGDERAAAARRLLADAKLDGHEYAIDGTLAVIARQQKGQVTVFTSDVDDLEKLLPDVIVVKKV
ncbi:ribbon-helix-helix domain-containing protein [Streptomyces sp. HPF1205]|uniref:ribbon-helix-helix domain-containing protein n=1 Tax=Streptomyces sp. HPF1205 TaxID=2873262 RepID=UPI001CED4F24|nr:ribbon-helix-helix domain-containing protein [Streptomyces sp. HPF1205]